MIHLTDSKSSVTSYCQRCVKGERRGPALGTPARPGVGIWRILRESPFDIYFWLYWEARQKLRLSKWFQNRVSRVGIAASSLKVVIYLIGILVVNTTEPVPIHLFFNKKNGDFFFLFDDIFCPSTIFSLARNSCYSYIWLYSSILLTAPESL